MRLKECRLKNLSSEAKKDYWRRPNVCIGKRVRFRIRAVVNVSAQPNLRQASVRTLSKSAGLDRL